MPIVLPRYIGVDSNCFTFVIGAMTGIERPMDALADEKVALFRCYMYSDGTLYATPKVREEIAAIPDESVRAHHESFFTSIFATIYPEDVGRVEAMAERFREFHRGESDCRIVAEAVIGELDVLLSFDNRLVTRLAPHTGSVSLMRPTEFWRSMNVPSGARPAKRPAPTNPLEEQDWWVW